MMRDRQVKPQAQTLLKKTWRMMKTMYLYQLLHLRYSLNQLFKLLQCRQLSLWNKLHLDDYSQCLQQSLLEL